MQSFIGNKYNTLIRYACQNQPREKRQFSCFSDQTILTWSTLPLQLAHTHLAGSMEWAHRDPFDRLLVAQASLENLAIITNDAQIQAHPWIDAVW